MAESVSLARSRWPRRAAKAEQVSAALERFVERVRSEFDLKLLVLFGSYADGTYHMDSDVDVPVVASGMPRGWGRRRVSLEQGGFPAKLQTFPYTPGEFLDMCREGSSVAYRGLTEGQVLYIDDEYRERLVKVL